VVQASERKIRLSDVDQEESMGIARREAMGRGIRLKRAERDIVNNDFEELRSEYTVCRRSRQNRCCSGSRCVGACIFRKIHMFVMPVLVVEVAMT